MARIKRNSAELLEGVLNAGSGTTLPIRFQSNRVITGLKQQIHVKRPNQYVSEFDK